MAPPAAEPDAVSPPEGTARVNRLGGRSQPLRVLMLVDSLRLGGAESILATLARSARAGDFTFDVASLDVGYGATATMLPSLERAGVSTRFLGLSRLVHPRALPAVYRAVVESRCDVVHAHLEHASVLAPPIATVAGRPAVCTVHHMAVDLPRREALKERLAIETASRLGAAMIFVSSASESSYAAKYRRRGNWTVIPNGVDLGAYPTEPTTLPPELEVPAHGPVVTIVGALRERKGHADAIRAWPAILARHPDARLLIVGSGAEEARLRSRADELGVSRAVVFAGTRADVPRLLAASTLALLPTRTEALPTALIEAGAAGLPAVASAIPGVEEVIVDGVTGFTVPVGDVGALADRVLRVLGDEELRRRMGAAARARAASEFSAELWCRRLGDLYASVVGPATGRLRRRGR